MSKIQNAVQRRYGRNGSIGQRLIVTRSLNEESAQENAVNLWQKLWQRFETPC